MNPLVLAVIKPLAVCLVAGLIRFGTDYQHNSALEPALIDGMLSAAYAAAAWLGVNGVVTQVQAAKTPKPQLPTGAAQYK